MTRLVALILVLLTLGSCTSMVQSKRLSAVADASGDCRSSLGAYNLPRALLTVKVTPKPDLHIIDFEEADFVPRIKGDPKARFCLDFLSTVTGDDLITVDRTTDGLLKRVMSNATDRTPEIAAKLADTAANVALITRSGLLGAAPTQPMKIDFDPLDPEDSASANEALRPYGYCVYVEQTMRHTHPAGWCDMRRKPRSRDPLYDAAQAPLADEPARQEILYRPNQTYDVVVMRKRDPYGPGRWETFITRKMEMPNRSPVFGIGVDRALFTERKTDLTFTDGVLTDVTIIKGSEALGFASIPLSIATTVADIPTRIIQIKIDMTNQRAKLIEAQGNLIKSWADYRAAVTPKAAAASAGGADSADGTRSLSIGQTPAAILSACVEGGGEPPVCEEISRRGLKQ